jgi:hypothetical protein
MGKSDNWLIVVRAPKSPFIIRRVYSFKSGSVIAVQNPTSAAPTELALTAEVAQLEGNISMKFDRIAGPDFYNCLEATFSGNLTIEELDLTEIYTLGFRPALGAKPAEDPAKFYPRFAGLAEMTVNPDAGLVYNDLWNYRVVGLAETLNASSNDNTEQPEDTEITALAYYYASKAISELGGLAAIDQARDFPTIGYLFPEVYNANYETYAGVLSDLAARVEVNEGCKVLWGVAGDRRIWFRLVGDGSQLADENATAVRVNWPNRVMQNYRNAIRWIIGGGNILSPFEEYTGTTTTLRTPDTLSHVSRADVGPFEKTESLDVPSHVLALKTLEGVYSSPDILVASYIGATADGTPSLERLSDANPISYCVFEMTPGAGDTTRSLFITVDLRALELPVADIVGVSLNFKPDQSNGGSDIPNGIYMIELRGKTGGTGETFVKRSGSIDEISGVFLLGDRARFLNDPKGATLADEIQILVRFTAASSFTDSVLMDVEDFRVFTIDKANLDLLAKREYRLPGEVAVKAEFQDGLRTLAPYINITKKGSLAIDFPDVTVQSAEYIISGLEQETTRTIYNTGQIISKNGMLGQRARDEAQRQRVRAVLKGFGGAR